MKETRQQSSDVKMLEEETQPHSLLADYVNVEHPVDEYPADEDFEASCLSKAILKWENIRLLFFYRICTYNYFKFCRSRIFFRSAPSLGVGCVGTVRENRTGNVENSRD